MYVRSDKLLWIYCRRCCYDCTHWHNLLICFRDLKSHLVFENDAVGKAKEFLKKQKRSVRKKQVSNVFSCIYALWLWGCDYGAFSTSILDCNLEQGNVVFNKWNMFLLNLIFFDCRWTGCRLQKNGRGTLRKMIWVNRRQSYSSMSRPS